MRKSLVIAVSLIITALVCITATSVTLNVYPIPETQIKISDLAAMSSFEKTVNAVNYELLVQTDNTSIVLQPTNAVNTHALFDCYVTATIFNVEGTQIASQQMDVLAPTNIILNLSRGAYDIIYNVEGITNNVAEPCEVSFNIEITQSPETCTQHFGVAHGYNPANGTLLTVLNTRYSCITDHRGFCNISMPRGAMYIAHAENVSDMHFWTCEETVVLLR
jgi:hypothetical protein